LVTNSITHFTRYRLLPHSISKPNNRDAEVWGEIDTRSREFIKAMINKDKNTLKQYLAKNISINSNEFEIVTINGVTAYPFLSNINDFKYRYRSVNGNIFTVGYELLDNKGSWVIVLDYINEDGIWKLQNIMNDI